MPFCHYGIDTWLGLFYLEVMNFPALVQMDAQGRIVLPQDVRGKGKKYFACQTEKDGTVHLIPIVGVITPKQAYFWTRRWQEGEKKATQALRRKKYRVVTPDKLDNYLKNL